MDEMTKKLLEDRDALIRGFIAIAPAGWAMIVHDIEDSRKIIKLIEDYNNRNGNS